ncbi:dienelactone hydrolase family protein [Bacillus sp. AFS055030]|uniref:dienelactone hydrolase family protein n=1 Tax=Bacillus sp. AFS055030 TaxID=2033507 RepID=UPI000BFD4A54|nr:dienelactone hydrolase family protein [Bacillus sp. AFS055030]PGL73248.1 dienelactone hydrolase [Bacillus sp. AFS055030]
MENCEFHHTTIIVVHEIYGINKHIKDICNSLNKLGFTVVCPNLLNNIENYCYKDEHKAYKHFTQEIGFELATNKIITLAKELRTTCNNLYILGFSVGATIAWLCSKYEGLFNGVIGFYGSRIRDYLGVSPKCETLLIFPTKEKSFDPEIVVTKLKTKDKVQIIKIEGSHGFTDPSTSNYDQYSTKYSFQKVHDFMIKQNHQKLILPKWEESND